MQNQEWNYKYYRAISHDELPNHSTISQKLHKITGFYANDYTKPVINDTGDLITIISDESNFKNHFNSSLVCLPYSKPSSIQIYEKKLERLVKKYGIKNIHMTDIFGKNKVLGRNKSHIEQFFDEYIEIVQGMNMICLGISINKDELLGQIGESRLSDEEIYFTLFWNNIEHFSKSLKKHSILHIYVEQEYNINRDNSRNVVPKLFQKLRGGINQFLQNTEQILSICKHPHYFSKSALLYSSLSDIVAYTCNKIQYKINAGVPHKKLLKEYRLILRVMKSSFNNVSGVPSKELRHLIESAHK
ncbi:hypothetical protein KAI19_01320 [bacterium]|nr:hypothetical protein [bacterium]